MAVNGIPFLLYSTGSGTVAPPPPPPPPPPNIVKEVTWPWTHPHKRDHELDPWIVRELQRIWRERQQAIDDAKREATEKERLELAAIELKLLEEAQKVEELLPARRARLDELLRLPALQSVHVQIPREKPDRTLSQFAAEEEEMILLMLL